MLQLYLALLSRATEFTSLLNTFLLLHRLGYDAVTYAELAKLMTEIVGQPFRYEPLAPEVFLEAMRSASAEMAYMGCVYDHWKRYATGTIPGADDNFPKITGKQPTRWADFIERHKAELAY